HVNEGFRVEKDTIFYLKLNIIIVIKYKSENNVCCPQGGTLIAVGLGVAAAGFAGRYAFQLWKPLGQMFSETVRKMPTSAFSSYYKGGFEQKMSKREASLVLGIR
uniref:DnaJ homolog subfamily C member 15-like n=1 Tax=Hippocampus comes TaxID=109280 RepID=A0A3Q2YDS3_HIPCM